MKLVGQIDHPNGLEKLLDLGCEEALVCSDLLSHEGGLGDANLKELLVNLEKNGLKFTLLFDRRVQEKDWDQVQGLSNFDQGRLRVMDLGLARKLNEKGVSFDLDLQIGHLNDRSIGLWVEKMKSIRRVVLNPQMPRRQLLPLLKNFPVESEVLGFGPIAMYQTPRPLLSWSGVQGETSIRSEEMGTGAFPMKESPWGSTLYYNKVLSLLPHLRELEEAGLDGFRVDLRRMGREEVHLFNKGYHGGDDIRNLFSAPLLHGFYGENKSDSLLDKIGGKRPDVSRKVFGEVLDGRGRNLLVRCLSSEWKKGDEIHCEDGKGRQYSFSMEGGENLEGSMVERPNRGDLIKLMGPKKFPVGTYLYY